MAKNKSVREIDIPKLPHGEGVTISVFNMICWFTKKLLMSETKGIRLRGILL